MGAPIQNSGAKDVRMMNYAKPEVVKAESAFAMVRGTEMKEPTPQVEELGRHTVPAYEAND